MKTLCVRLMAGIGLFFGLAMPTWADVTVACPFGDHMVLQRGAAVVWGTATPESDVTLTFREKTTEVAVNAQGQWRASIPTGEAGGPFELVIAEKAPEKPHAVTLTDILVGEVWLGSGQSNMNMSLMDGRGGVLNHEAEIKAAEYPSIRFLQIPNGRDAHNPKYERVWTACEPDTARHFSAALYFFARRLSEELKIPVGVINASQGGSAIAGWLPGGDLYKKCIDGLVPLTIKGVLWYQGESDVGAANQYGEKMNGLIAGWRTAWGAEWPFYAVQIAPHASDPFNTALIWGETLRALDGHKATGMVSTFDIGDLTNIHPKNKQAVGLRLANLALREQYGKGALPAYSPRFGAVAVADSRARVTFAQAEGGLATVDGSAPDWFQIAGEDQIFHWAQTKIDGDTVEAWSPDVAKPVALRYGWDATAMPNLIGKDSRLPALPFRTDSWAKADPKKAGASTPLAIPTLSPDITAATLDTALLAHAPISLISGGRTLGTMRLGTRDRLLAVRLDVTDALVTPDAADWKDISIEFYAAKTGDKTVRQVVLIPSGMGTVKHVEWYEMGKKQDAAALPIANMAPAAPNGYTLTAVIPLAALGIPDEATAFTFEAAAATAPHAQANRSWRSFFGSMGAFQNASRFRPCQIEK